MMYLAALLVLPALIFQVFVGAFIYLCGKLTKNEKRKQYGYQLALSADQNANAILMGFPDETISSRIGRAVFVHKKPKKFVKYLMHPLVDTLALLFDDKNHCEKAIEHSEEFHLREEVWEWYES